MKDTIIKFNKNSSAEAPLNARMSPWIKRFAVGFTVLSCVFYAGLVFLILIFQQRIEGHIKELPIFTRIVLNIYQPFLVVFILISMALIILLYLKLKHLDRKRSGGSYKPLLALIAFNFIFAAVLFGVTFVGIR